VISKKKLVSIVKNIAQNEEEKTSLLFYTSVKKINTKKKKLIIIFNGKRKILNFLYFFFYAIFSGTKFKKNSFLLFHLKNELIGHNFIPDWPGAYFNQSIIKNIHTWIKKIIYIFIFKKKLLLIFTKIN
jgi:hypothetical protein